MGNDSFDQRANERAKGLIGQVVDGRYQIDRILAMGGMGSVYLARHLKLRKRVALKVLHPGTEDHPELYMRFEREALAGAQVTHAHVAAATDFGELADGTRYLVLEYVRGRTLRAVLDEDAPLLVLRAAKITRQISVALREIHARGIVHRDLKPRNVMLGESDFVKIVDFGLARIDGARISTVSSDELEDDERLTTKGTIFGTIEYLAPEAAFGMDLIDARADLYALGVMFYEMLTGKHPFDAKTEAELFAKQRLKAPPPFRERAPQVAVPAAVEEIVMKLLEKDFDARYQTADELINALDAALPEARVAPREPMPPIASEPPSASEPPRDEPPNSKRSVLSPATVETKQSRGKPNATLIVAAVAIVAVTGYLLSRGDEATGESGATSVASGTPTVVTATPSLIASASATASASASASAIASAIADPPVDAAAIETLRATLKKNNLGSAVDQALTQLQRSGSLLADKDARRVVRKLLVTLAQDRHERASELYLAAGTLQGQRGPDLLYDLLEASGRSAYGEKATEALSKAEVLALASPAVRVAFQMRVAPCDEKLGMVERAVTDGDERALVAMQIVVRGCVKDTRRVDSAIRRLKDRLR